MGKISKFESVVRNLKEKVTFFPNFFFIFFLFLVKNSLGKVEILKINDKASYCTKCSIPRESLKKELEGFHGI